MCGIAGVFNINPNEVSLKHLKLMTDSIAHRGPDGEGHWVDESGRLALGHRRLSIIDLSTHAAQPMHYLERYTITYNGEIYNYLELKQLLTQYGYKFKSLSDTEVLLALYDRYREKCLQYLDGMFAFALYDNETKQLFCARDRFGEKPFHYSYKKNSYFIFGSEIKQIFAYGIKRDINNVMLYNYMNNGFLHNPKDQSESFYNNVKKLKQSHYLIVDTNTGNMSEVKYWDIDLSNTMNLNAKEISERFKYLMNMSVTRRLRSDVPIGSSLSGGLDSSLLVSLIDKLNGENHNLIHQKTFSARFVDFSRDESYYQNLVTKQVKADAYFTYPDDQTLLNKIDKICYHQDEPFASSSILAQYEVFELAKKNGVTVLLDGQGADEILAGYHSYFQYFFIEQQRQGAGQGQWNEYVNLHKTNTTTNIVERGLKYKIRSAMPFAFDFLRSLKDKLSYDRGAFSEDYYASYRSRSFKFDSNYTTLNGILKQSTLNGPLQDLLRYADRNSMAHSREVRLPFLNHELVEFLFSLPSSYKINNGWTKYLMRTTFEDVLPKEIAWRVDKIGFEPPQKKWLNNKEVKEMIHENISHLVKNGILDKKILTQKDSETQNEISNDQDEWKMLMAGKLVNA